ncbi:MAG: tetratricopeptide repeat protein [Pseudomonadota bacterium]
MLAIRTADHLLERQESSAAADVLERYLAAHPPHGRVLQRLGRVRLMQGRAAEAAHLLEQALECCAPEPAMDDEVVAICTDDQQLAPATPPSAAAR